jgi:acyl-CoA thioester hydrolase
MEPYRITRTVQQKDLDTLQHMNNVRYLEWVQDISKKHWETLTTPQWEESYLWVVRSHNITYHAAARYGDILAVSTFVASAKGPLSTRVVRFHKKDSETLVAECRTEWILLNRENQRPVRIPGKMWEVLSPTP